MAREWLDERDVAASRRLRYARTAAVPPRKSAVARMRMTKTIRCRYMGVAEAAAEIEDAMPRDEAADAGEDALRCGWTA